MPEKNYTGPSDDDIKGERLCCLDLTLPCPASIIYRWNPQLISGHWTGPEAENGIPLHFRTNFTIKLSLSLNASFSHSHGSTHWLLISVLSSPMFFVRVFPVLSPHLSVDCGLQPGPASGSGSYWQTGWKAAARCSHLATGLASVRPLIRCLLSPTRTLGCVQSPQRYHDLGSRLQKCIHAVCRGKYHSQKSCC